MSPLLWCLCVWPSQDGVTQAMYHERYQTLFQRLQARTNGTSSEDVELQL